MHKGSLRLYHSDLTIQEEASTYCHTLQTLRQRLSPAYIGSYWLLSAIHRIMHDCTPILL
jgi:hypothetical protein